MFGLMLKRTHIKKMTELEEKLKHAEEESENWHSILMSVESKKSAEIADLILKLQDKMNRINSVEFKTMEEYKKTQEELDAKQNQLQKDIESCLKFEEDVQKQLSKALHESVEFGFQYNMAIPGSISIRDEIHKETDENGESKKVDSIRGRIIFDDAMTAKLSNEISLQKRFSMILDYMQSLGTFNQISRMIMRSNGIQYALAYNEDCTCLELYYQLDLELSDKPYQLVLDTDHKE